MTLTQDQAAGCLLGLALGDALGAPHEGGILERALWRLIGRTRTGEARWTDDTRMALDLAESVLRHHGVQPDDLARQFAASYSPSRGYGPGTAKVLKRIRAGQHWSAASRSVFPGGSYGNGAAMRAPVLALFYGTSREELLAAVQASSEVTHRHSIAVEGAVAVAVATQELLLHSVVPQVLANVRDSCRLPDFRSRLAVASTWLEEGARPSASEVAARLGNGMTAPTSCITAVYSALRHLASPFETMIQSIASLGGDVDTIGAMAGALWGAANGASALPAAPLEGRRHLEETAARIFRHATPAGNA
ncbi:MAG: ADP-ribosylglycohydrolase family protein [Holophagales bacterium]|jgi:poly(ADP-ribose) glycohydrolase ARH3|nr:ADP-ribosylglycohydrolase family protein [Holophagales bacterium]